MILTRININFKNEICNCEIENILHTLFIEYTSKCSGFCNGFYFENQNNEWTYYSVFDNTTNAVIATADYDKWPPSSDQIKKIKENGVNITQYEIVLTFIHSQ